MEIISFILFVLIIIILSALISGSEAALLSVSYAKAKELHSDALSLKHKKKALLLLDIKENLQKYITTIVVLNNIVNIVGSIYVGVLASKMFGDLYLGIVSAILTFLIIIFAEIIPKIYGERHCNSISLFVARPLKFLTFLLTPINFTLNLIIKIFVKEKVKAQVSEGEIREMAYLGMQEGSIDSYENEVIENVFRMNDITAYDIMEPKNRVVVIENNAKYEEIIELVKKTGFTRFPVEKNSEIIGLINVKDLFKFYEKEKEFNVSKIQRPIIYAPEAMKLSALEEKLKKAKIHMAVIVNEYGDFTGIVTLEDIIEELLGEITDEFDQDDSKLIEKRTEHKFHIMTEIEISQLNEDLDLNIDEDGDFSTLNGYLIELFGKIPTVNEIVSTEFGTFRVIQRSKKKIIQVEFIKEFLEEDE